MKKVVRLLIMFLFLLPQTVFACTYPQNCNFTGNDPSSGQQACTGSPDPETGLCVWDPSIDPNCSLCEQIILPTSTPSPTPTPTPTVGPEEKAVYNLSQGTLPEGLVKESVPENKNILEQFFNNAGKLLSNIFGGLFFGFIVDSQKMYTQSDNINQAGVPQKLVPQKGNVGTNIQEYLGGSTGVYSVKLPKEIQQINPAGAPIGQAEKAFERANFPEGVNPITGQK